MEANGLRLLDIPRGSKIYCKCGDGSEFVTFLRLDGMYSFCETEKGAIAHLGALQPLEEAKDGYNLAI